MNENNKYELVKYIDGEFELEVTLDPKEEIVWMNQEEIAILFNSAKQNVSFHIKNILE